MKILASIEKRLELSENWSENVETKWTPPEGFFTKSAQQIAKGLYSASDSLKQAMSRLDFYMNRAGTNLSDEDTIRLNRAKTLLRYMYEDSTT